MCVCVCVCVTTVSGCDSAEIPTFIDNVQDTCLLGIFRNVNLTAFVTEFILTSGAFLRCGTFFKTRENFNHDST